MISIIIPIYNGEKTIARCIDSILCSRNTNFEVIIVNDGSTDNSNRICKHYANIDNRISVTNIPNGGVSNARNLGIKSAKGEWIVFIDADDYIDSDFLTIPNELANVDVIEKGYTILRGKSCENVDITYNTTMQSKHNMDKYIVEYVNYKTRALWNKIFKRIIVESIWFRPEVTMGEDFLFFLECYPAINSYALSPIGKYYYCETNNSATAKNFKNTAKRIDGLLHNASTITGLIKQNSNIPIYPYMLYNIYMPIISQYNKTLTTYQKDVFYKIKKSLLTADFSLIGRINQLKYIFECLKEYLNRKIRLI